MSTSKELYPIAVIRNWLENYPHLREGISTGTSGNSSARPIDGIKSSLLSKIILDEAIEQLPEPEHDILTACYIVREPQGDTCKRLAISVYKYRGLLFGAVSMVWHSLNNGRNHSHRNKLRRR